MLVDPKTLKVVDSYDTPICENGLKCPVDEGKEFTTDVVYQIPKQFTQPLDILVKITSPPNHTLGCATTSKNL